jgi:DNA-binding transcriptional MocR family regulator
MNDDQHMAWPSLERICYDMKIVRTTAIKHLASLENAGFLEKQRRFGQSTVYYARFPESIEISLADASSPKTGQMDEHSSPESGPSVVQNLDTNSSLNRSNTYTSTDHQEFDAFWAAYPRHEGKAPAQKVWGRLKPKERKAALEDCRSRLWPNEKQYVPHARTYLSQRRWEDERPEAAQTPFGVDL